MLPAKYNKWLSSWFSGTEILFIVGINSGLFSTADNTAEPAKTPNTHHVLDVVCLS